VSAMTISWIVFACVFAGALLGMTLRHLLPEHHLKEDTKDVVKLGMSLIATMAALVLALLIASAKSSHDEHRNHRNVRRFSSCLTVLWPVTEKSRQRTYVV
jgi:hypothetical protein